MTVSSGVTWSLPMSSSYLWGHRGECLHTGEETLTLTQNQLSEALRRPVGVAQRTEGRGQSYPGGPLQ